MFSTIFVLNVLPIYVCFKIYFLIDHLCKIQREITDLLEKGRIYLSSRRVYSDNSSLNFDLINFYSTMVIFALNAKYLSPMCCLLVFRFNFIQK